MKKNLRIVSAAAAALLAVAPVAASAVSTVNAAAVNAIAVGGSATPLPNNSDVQISSSVAGVTTKNGSSYTNGRISGSINASYNGTSYQQTLVHQMQVLLFQLQAILNLVVNKLTVLNQVVL